MAASPADVFCCRQWKAVSGHRDKPTSVTPFFHYFFEEMGRDGKGSSERWESEGQSRVTWCGGLLAQLTR